MSVSVKPTTLVGIKRYAKQIKKSDGLSHQAALDRAAQAADFQNFRHAQRKLPAGDGRKQREKLQDAHPHRLYLTAYWRDRKSGVRGRETLAVDLGVGWMQLIKPSKFANDRTLGSFRVVAPDHFESSSHADSQSSARRRICAAVRTLRFIEATGLQPAKGYGRVFTGGVSVDDVPGRDHASVWYQPTTKRYVFVNEPYEAAAQSVATEREAWGREHGIEIARPNWAGMYNPDGGSQLYLFSQAGRGVLLADVVAKLNKLPLPMIEGAWNGTSAAALPIFVSPRQGEPVRPIPMQSDSEGSSSGQRRRGMHWGRKLLVLALNHLVDQKHVSLSGTGGERGHCEAEIAGRRTKILWEDIGFQEQRLSVWWDYDHSRHPQANLRGNSREEFRTGQPLAKRHRYREFVGATVSGWVERDGDKYLQGRGARGLTDLYLRQAAKADLDVIDDPLPVGFEAEGRFRM